MELTTAVVLLAIGLVALGEHTKIGLYHLLASPIFFALMVGATDTLFRLATLFVGIFLFVRAALITVNK